METSDMLIIIGVTIGALIGGYLLYKYLTRDIEVTEEVIDGELSKNEVVEYFKGFQLRKDIDVCAIFAEGTKFVEAKDGYKSLGLFLLTNEKVSKAKIIRAKSFDAELIKMMGMEKCIKII